jgi:hypothetical protein
LLGYESAMQMIEARNERRRVRLRRRSQTRMPRIKLASAGGALVQRLSTSGNFRLLSASCK